jgi:tRNA nucleotidyltransferase (CCA-adding enzyme)
MQTPAMRAPTTAAEATQRLGAAPVPDPILEVARVLQRAGHAAVLVGGAVRDVLIGLDAADWDVATSARPDEVQAAFKRTVPTGIEHGTVTVLVRAPEAPRGTQPVAVEVTTFRGEGGYTDGRRPTEVRFLRDLVEDLARRDFTVNAFAWDPIGHVFTDPFDGLADLRAGLLRAVGEARLRFAEDGLRTMRAVRLCATRQLALERETAAAIATALDVLAKVSRERVHVELVKLLEAPEPSRGLVPMHATGVWPIVLPPLGDDEREAAIAAVDRLPRDAVVRTARLLRPAAARDRAVVEPTLDALRFGRTQRAHLVALLTDAADALVRETDAAAIRRAAAAIGRARVDDALALADSTEVTARVTAALHGAALELSELAIAGRDLVAEGVSTPGPRLGAQLKALLDAVLDDPRCNEREHLLALARRT